jgi:putative intracellular protease/amidase
MRKLFKISTVLLGLIGLSTAASLWATTVPPYPLRRDAQAGPNSDEKIAAYQPRFGRKRPVIAIVGENSATELTDFVIPYGILAKAAVADLITVGTKPGVMTMRPALQLQPDTTTAGFDDRYPEGADYVIVPAVVKRDDPTLLSWLKQQAAKGSTIVSICDGALVVANAGLMNGHRATAHWATLDYRRKHFPDVNWIENSRYVADGRIVSSAGISAAIPTSLALVAAIAGPDRAAIVARDIAVDDWSSSHDSQVFALSFGRNLTALATTNVINPNLRRQQSVGVPIAQGVDEVALALTADAYSRTGLSKAFSVASSNQPVSTAQGLRFLPDRVSGQGGLFDRTALVLGLKPGEQLDAILAAITRDYGRLIAFGVAIDFEYPGFK